MTLAKSPIIHCGSRIIKPLWCCVTSELEGAKGDLSLFFWSSIPGKYIMCPRSSTYFKHSTTLFSGIPTLFTTSMISSQASKGTSPPEAACWVNWNNSWIVLVAHKKLRYSPSSSNEQPLGAASYQFWESAVSRILSSKVWMFKALGMPTP